MCVSLETISKSARHIYIEGNVIYLTDAIIRFQFVEFYNSLFRSYTVMQFHYNLMCACNCYSLFFLQ